MQGGWGLLKGKRRGLRRILKQRLEMILKPGSFFEKVNEELTLLGENNVEVKLERAINAGLLRVSKDKNINSSEVKYDGHNRSPDNNNCQSFFCDNLLSSTSTFFLILVFLIYM